MGLIVAPPKAGKSWLVCGIGLACASGGVALGAIAVPKRPVLYLALEDGKRRLQSRGRRIMGGQPSDPYSWDYAIGNQLKETIDTVAGATLLLVHHTRNAESADFIDSLSGTQGIAGCADFVLVLQRKRHENNAVLSVTGRDITEAEYALHADDGILWRLDGEDLLDASETAERRRLSDTRSDRTMEIFSIVAACPKPVSPAEVSEILGLNNDTVGRYLRRLVDDGYITRAGRGLYKSASEVSEPSESPLPDTTDASDTVSQPPPDMSPSGFCSCGAELAPDNDTGRCRECALVDAQAWVNGVGT